MATADLDSTARALLACVCEALDEAQRPTCQCYATIGPPVIGPENCCSCDSGDSDYYGPTTTTGETTVHVEQVYFAEPDTLEQATPVLPCRRLSTVADMTLVVTRCYPTISETGEMPDPDTVDENATAMHSDIETVFKALTCGCSDLRLLIRSVGVNAMPEAGCAALAAQVSVEVRI